MEKIDTLRDNGLFDAQVPRDTSYAHVLWMSKRQVVITDADLPDNKSRSELALMARSSLQNKDLDKVGIDHFASAQDGLPVDQITTIHPLRVSLMRQLSDVIFISQKGLEMYDWAKPLVRIIDNFVNSFTATETAHSTAI